MTTLRTAYYLFPTQIGPTGPKAPPGADKFNTLASWVMWGVVLILVIAAFIAAGKLALDKRSGQGGDGEGLAKVAIAAVIVASAVAIVNTLVI